MSANSGNEKPAIQIQEKGPYWVKGINKVVDSDGIALQEKEKRVLCRCGNSNFKPFCDGSHMDVRFNDQDRYRINQEDYEKHDGESITIHFNKRKCSNAGICYTSLAAVFGSEDNRVINPDVASADMIQEVVSRCPSGALYCSRNGAAVQEAVTDVSITIMKNGPYQVTGSVEITEGKSRVDSTPPRHTLCRCGKSSAKPYCDGSHKTTGFRDDHLIAIARLDDLKDELTRAVAAGRELVIVKRQSELSVFSGVCLHAEALLYEGFIEENHLTCGRHRWRYKLETGELDGDPSFQLKKLQTFMEDGWLLVDRKEVNTLSILEDD